MPARLARFSVAVLLLAGSLLPAAAQDAPRSVAVTFDDLPINSLHADLPTWTSTTERLLGHVTAHAVPVIGFVNERKLYVNERLDTARVALLRRWLDAGLDLGNHTFSHPDLHETPLAAYQDDVVRGEPVTTALLDEAGASLRYFRHPFLHTGRDLETKHAVEAFLHERGYRVAPVTIDNAEWIFARAYERALADDDAMAARIAETYVAYMDEVFAYYEQQTQALFGRTIPQVLLLHANTLNADTFDALVAMMQQRGYTFITLDEALQDPAYTSPDTYTGPAGITWLHRWALTRGVDRSFFRGEPEAPAFVLEQAGMASP